MPELNRVIVIGGSTGAMDGFKAIVEGLPPDVPAAVLVVHHLPSEGPNLLADILRRTGRLPAATAHDDQTIEAGRVYVAPADHHLLVAPGDRLRVTHGPRENRARPAIDPLFRSAAAVYGPRTVGVLLSGMLDDGTAGLWAVRERGGVTIVQNPEEAVAPAMPLNALKQVEVNHCLGIERIAPTLVELARRPMPVASGERIPPEMDTEVRIAAEENARESGIEDWGKPSFFACPECHGVLLQRAEGKRVRYRCHTGHAYSLEALVADAIARTEEALWNALRGIDEVSMLFTRLAADAESGGDAEAAARIRAHASAADERANALRKVLLAREAAANSRAG